MPLDRLSYFGNRTHYNIINASPYVLFPARHGSNASLQEGIALAFRYLRIAA